MSSHTIAVVRTRPSVLNWIWPGLVAVVMALIVRALDNPSRSVAFLPAILVGVSWAAWVFLRRRPLVTLEEHGVRDHFLGATLIPWEQVGPAKVATSGVGLVEMEVRERDRVLASMPARVQKRARRYLERWSERDDCWIFNVGDSDYAPEDLCLALSAGRGAQGESAGASAPSALLFNVVNLTRSVAFYEQLGFSVADRWVDEEGELGWCRLDRGPNRLMLNRCPDGGPDARSKRPDYTDAVLYLYVEDAGRMFADLQRAGVPARNVGSQSYGLDEVWLRDPDGYQIVVASEKETASV